MKTERTWIFFEPSNSYSEYISIKDNAIFQLSPRFANNSTKMYAFKSGVVFVMFHVLNFILSKNRK